VLTAEQAERRRLLFKLCLTKEELHDWAYVFLDVDLPDSIVDAESNTTPLGMMWDIYHYLTKPPDNPEEEERRELTYACRDGGKCVEKGTLLLTKARGLVPIENVVLGEEIWSGRAWRTVTDWIHDGIKSAVALETSTGHRLTTSKIHRVWSWTKSGGIGWVRVADLAPGDYVQLDTGMPVEDADPDAYDKGYLCGLLTGDGCTRLLPYQTTLTTSDPGVLKYWKDACVKWAGKEPTQKKSRPYDWYVDGKQVGETFLSWGLKPVLAKDKEIPESCLRNRAALAGFVSGLFDTDGTYDKGMVAFDTVSEKLARGLLVALAALGVRARLTPGKYRYKGEVRKKYTVVVAATDAPRLEQAGVRFSAKKAGELNVALEVNNTHDNVPRWGLQPLLDLPGVRGGPDRKGCPQKPVVRDYPTVSRQKALEVVKWVEDLGIPANEWRRELERPWIQVRSVTDGEADFYDLTVDHDHSYWSAGLVSHNTLTEAMVETAALLHVEGPESLIVHLAAIEEQSNNAQRYLKKFFRQPDLRGFVNSDNIRTTEVVFYRPHSDGPVLTESEWRELPADLQATYTQVVRRAEVVVATMASVNGKHCVMLCLDELDVMRDRRVYEETRNIPTEFVDGAGDRRPPITVLTSTRKTAGGFVQEEIDDAARTGLVIKHFNLIDITRACPATRHRPDLPRLPIYRSDEELRAISETDFAVLDPKRQARYVKDEGYSGCLTNCRIFAACKGRLATHQLSDSKFLKTIAYTTGRLRVNSVEMARAQLLCQKPASTGLIYPTLDRARHVLTPGQAYERVFGKPHPRGQQLTKAELMAAFQARGMEFGGGIDFGFSHIFAAVLGVKDGNIGYVLRAPAYPQLQPAQQLAIIDTFKAFDPDWWPDTENPQMISVLKTGGHRMKEWKKLAGSVLAGIEAVRWKLMPALGEPELFFVRDIGEDPEIDLLLKRLGEHKWKTDAGGRPTDKPLDDNKDLPDAIRYWVMNTWKQRGRIIMTEDAPPLVTGLLAAPAPYSQENWVQQAVASALGVQVTPDQMRPRPGGYYATPGSSAAPAATEAPARRRSKLMLTI
jgi:hypothetical protein